MTMSPASSHFPTAVRHRLRSAIRDSHERTEKTPIACAMLDGTVTRGSYAALLSQLIHIHERFESVVERLAMIHPLPRELVFRSAALRTDLAFIGQAPQPPLAITSEMVRWLSGASSPELMGCTYVVIGSIYGSQVLRRHLARAFGVDDQPGQGLDFHRHAMHVMNQVWADFGESLEQVPPCEVGEVLRGAAALMMGLEQIYRMTKAVP